MKKFSVALAAFLCALLCASSGFAYDNTGFVPDTLAWFTDSIVEQWTLTEDVNSEIFEQTHFSRENDIEGEHDAVPVSQRFNRQLVITMGFINLGTKVYRFDNSSRLDAFIIHNKKKVVADAVPMTSKTVIAPNGRVKKCSFVIKMNKRSFIEAFDNRHGIGALTLNTVSDKLIIEDPDGNSLFDEVDTTPGFVTFISLSNILGPQVYFQFNKEYTLKDILININRIEKIKNPGNSVAAFDINNDEIEKVLGIPNEINDNVCVLFSFNDNAVDNKNTSKELAKPFGFTDKFRIAFVPTSILREYLPDNVNFILFRPFFKETIARLPESIAPKKYQDVNNADSLKESYLKLKEFAEAGDNEAIGFIGIKYDPSNQFFKDGFLFEDYQDAFQWFKQLADKGYSQAQFITGLYYENGFGVEQDFSKAVKYYKLSAEQGYDAAMVAYAAFFAREDDEANLEEAVKWFTKAAELGNRVGQFKLAIILLFSKDGKQRKEGIEWLTKSADSEYPPALYYLALEYKWGENVPKDEEKTLALMFKAADLGFSRAYGMLGQFYLRGTGVEADEKLAVAFYKLGADAKDPESMFWYGRFLCDGFQVEKDILKGCDLIKESATMGNADAMLFIGVDYLIGKYGNKDDKEAVYWIEQAANKGHTRAMTILGDFHMGGLIVAKDVEKALYLYRKAAAKGDSLGFFRLGKYLYEQKGDDAQMGLSFIKIAAVNLKEAQEYLKKLDISEDDDEIDDSLDDEDVEDLDDPFDSNDDEVDVKDDDDLDDEDIEDLDEEDIEDLDEEDIEDLDEEDAAPADDEEFNEDPFDAKDNENEVKDDDDDLFGVNVIPSSSEVSKLAV